MKTQLEQRLSALRSEFESGQKMLAEYHVKQTDLRETLWRISGAIQVLEELMQDEEPEGAATEVGDDIAEPSYAVGAGT